MPRKKEIEVPQLALVPASEPSPAEKDPLFSRLLTQVQGWQQSIKGLTITDDASFQVFGTMLVKIKEAESDANLVLKDQIAAANKAHKSLTELRGTLLKALEKLHAAVEEPMQVFRLKQIETRETVIESDHAAIESNREELLHQAQKLQADAAAAKERMDMRGARELQQKAQDLLVQSQTPISVVIAANQKPAIAGLGEAYPWGAVIEDPMELIKAVADGRVPLIQEVIKKGVPEMKPIILIDESVVTYLAKRYEKDLNLPGCKAKQGLQFRRQAE